MNGRSLRSLPESGRIHLVGVGGAGMSGLARVLLQRGHDVSGTDLKESRVLDEVRALGGRVEVGHDAEAVAGADLVVRSSAVPDENPELTAAREQGIPVWPRARLLAALMEGATRVLVAGTHGKTTTTSMIVVALQSLGLDPSFAIGGQLNEVGTNAHAGEDPIFVAEADESDRSFLQLTAEVAVVLNVELDHPDEFDSEEDVRAAFATFLERRSGDAPAVVCLDDDGCRSLLDEHDPAAVITYGEDPSAEVRLLVDADTAAVRAGGDRLGELRLGVPGRHNLLNATAAVAVCRALELDAGAALDGLAAFAGVARRFQRIGEAGRVRVVDDYAHHPTELRTTLAAAREDLAARGDGSGRVVLVVQPHRYSRTAALGAELGRAAAAADVVVVTEVYASGEQPIPGVSGQSVAEAAREAGAQVVWEPHLGDLTDRLAGLVEPGDLVLVTGAGDITQLGPALLERLSGTDRTVSG